MSESLPNVQRYNPDQYHGMPRLEEADDGEVVLFEDYSQLQSRCAELEAERDEWHSSWLESYNEAREFEFENAQQQARIAELVKAIPTTWLDPLLTGRNKVLPEGYSYSTADIETLLSALKQRLEGIAQQPTPPAASEARDRREGE